MSERLEYPGQGGGIYADAGILYRQNHALIIGTSIEGYSHLAAALRKLARVMQQIADDLFDPRSIACEKERLIRKSDFQRQPARFETFMVGSHRP